MLQEAIAVSQDADPQQARPLVGGHRARHGPPAAPGASAMNAARISDRIAPAIEDLDVAASPMTNDKSTDIALLASDLFDLRMEIERELMAMVAA